MRMHTHAHACTHTHTHTHTHTNTNTNTHTHTNDTWGSLSQRCVGDTVAYAGSCARDQFDRYKPPLH
jgi:hypothetical protein